jgi:hypothetical protein
MMWNAGILGIHSSHAARSLAEVLRITDLVCSGLDKHINEQFAFSYVLQTGGEVVPTAALLVHYCGDVDHVLSRFREFLEAHRDAELADLCAAAVTLDARADVQHRKTTSAERVLAVFTRLGRSVRKRVRRLRRRRALGE